MRVSSGSSGASKVMNPSKLGGEVPYGTYRRLLGAPSTPGIICPPKKPPGGEEPMAMLGGDPTYTRPLVEHSDPAELLEPTERRRMEVLYEKRCSFTAKTWLFTNSGGGYPPEVVRGRVPRWLQVGGVLLLGGEPTVKRTVRGLADPPWGCTLGPAGALGGGHNLAFHLKEAFQQKMLMMSRYSTCVHWSLCVQAVSAALVGLSTQSDSDWLLGQTTRTDRSALTTSDSGDIR